MLADEDPDERLQSPTEPLSGGPVRAEAVQGSAINNRVIFFMVGC